MIGNLKKNWKEAQEKEYNNLNNIAEKYPNEVSHIISFLFIVFFHLSFLYWVASVSGDMPILFGISRNLSGHIWLLLLITPLLYFPCTKIGEEYIFFWLYLTYKISRKDTSLSDIFKEI